MTSRLKGLAHLLDWYWRLWLPALTIDVVLLEFLGTSGWPWGLVTFTGVATTVAAIWPHRRWLAAFDRSRHIFHPELNVHVRKLGERMGMRPVGVHVISAEAPLLIWGDRMLVGNDRRDAEFDVEACWLLAIRGSRVDRMKSAPLSWRAKRVLLLAIGMGLALTFGGAGLGCWFVMVPFVLMRKPAMQWTQILRAIHAGVGDPKFAELAKHFQRLSHQDRTGLLSALDDFRAVRVSPSA